MKHRIRIGREQRSDHLRCEQYLILARIPYDLELPPSPDWFAVLVEDEFIEEALKAPGYGWFESNPRLKGYSKHGSSGCR